MYLLTKSDVLELHQRALDAHGGLAGLLDEGGLESAIAAVLNRVAYEDADVVACAATYAFHLTQAHAFVDGNKRAGAAAMLSFLFANDRAIRATEDELVDLFLGIAAGRKSRDEVEGFLRDRVAELR